MEDGAERDVGEIEEEQAVSSADSANEGVADLPKFDEDACVGGYCGELR